MRILIIEDNLLVAESLRHGLKSSYAIDVTNSGRDALSQADVISYDLLILDLTLPDLDGESVYKLLRDKSILTPILVITGRDTVQSKVKLLDLGVNDYLTKPFNIDEVKARIRSILRQAPHSNSRTTLTFDDLILDPASRTVTRHDQLIKLRRKEFDLLEFLMRNPGKTLTRPMILENIWDITENLWANVIDVHIKHLRDKIDRPFPCSLIQTVHGVGYKLELEFENNVAKSKAQ